jgi:hypothetical protein
MKKTYRYHKYDLYIQVDNNNEKIPLVHQKCMILHFDMDSEDRHHLIENKPFR